jgi:hypothetical protein
MAAKRSRYAELMREGLLRAKTKGEKKKRHHGAVAALLQKKLLADVGGR